MVKMNKFGITLIEILVSICIILFIAASSMPALHRARNKAVIAKTKAIIDTIEAALSIYETDFGDYPENQANGSKILLEILQGPIESDRWHGPYIRLKKDQIDKEGNILDGWKMPIIYKYQQDLIENMEQRMI
jgi:type II secretion system protein G